MTDQPKSSLGKWLGRGLLALIGLGLVGFIMLQLVPVQRDNPPIVSEPNWDSPGTHELAKRACFDCHSNETVWPWYAYVAPMSWLVTHDVQEGRQILNFSEWQGRGGRMAHETAEVIREGEMPLANYLMMHPEARLTDGEKQQLIDGLQASLGR